jgi:hypothetical protein
MFVGVSGRRLILFLPKPSPFSRRSEAWRVTAKEYADSATRFAAIGMIDWYLQSVWVPVRMVENWCSGKGYEIHAAEATIDHPTPLSPQTHSIPPECRPRPGPKDKYEWKVIKAAVFLLMDKHGEFCRARGWIQARLIDRILEDFGDEQPDESVLKRRLPSWLKEWRETRKHLAP